MDTVQITNEAIERVRRHADEAWCATASAALSKLARKRLFFTTDDLWAIVPEVIEPRAMGAIVRQAQADGLIKATNDFQISQRSECHRRPLRVWSSLVFMVTE